MDKFASQPTIQALLPYHHPDAVFCCMNRRFKSRGGLAAIERILTAAKSIRVAVSRQRIYAIIESADPDDEISRIADFAIVSLIVLNVMAVTLESVNSLGLRYRSEFFWFEIISVAVFSVEYLLRLWACVSAGNVST